MNSVNNTSKVLGVAFLLQAITSLISGLILKLPLIVPVNISIFCYLFCYIARLDPICFIFT